MGIELSKFKYNILHKLLLKPSIVSPIYTRSLKSSIIYNFTSYSPHPIFPLPRHYFPTPSLSHHFFKSRLNPSNPPCVFFLIPIAFAIHPSPIINASGPENSSSWMNVVPPGVVLLGWKWNMCSPLKSEWKEPYHRKEVGEFSWGCVLV